MRFSPRGSIKGFQEFNHKVYGPIDDRFYDTTDLLTQNQRFAMRALKGIRKSDAKRLSDNLLISFSFLSALANRFRIDLEAVTWERFPALCSYCGSRPCVCKVKKPVRRPKLRRSVALRPRTLAGFQKMFAEVYPPSTRTLEHAGIHFAEEVGEVAEAVFYLLRSHNADRFKAVEVELADYLSCLFGIANSANIDVAQELARLFKNNCHVCHKLPCVCTFSFVARIKT